MDIDWDILKPNHDALEEICRRLKIPPLVAKVLINRGITNSHQAYNFLYPQFKQLHNPFLLKDMDKAVRRIYEAIIRQESVAIYGDYDVDGITGTAILYLFLKPLLNRLTYYLPHRLKEGYGLHASVIKKMASMGINLLITTDCGSSNVEEIKLASDLGMDVIVIDHHEVPKLPPPTLALINPKRPDCPFPFKELAGVGVSFNLLIALRQFLVKEGIFSTQNMPNLKRYLDLVALGTVADIVPLIDENRVFVKYGLQVLAQTDRPGLKSLKKVSGLNRQINTTDIGFRLAPRLNAAGRMASPELALKLLLTSSPSEAENLAQSLNELNKKRQQLEEKILREAEQIFRCQGCGVLAKDGWHPGVIGIVASKLTDMFDRPILLISLEENLGKGSGRSVAGCDLFGLLNQCQEYLVKFGGHKMAAGFQVSLDNLDKFTSRFETLVKEFLKERPKTKLTVDAEVKLPEISSFCQPYLELLPPYGFGNPEPLFCARDLKVRCSTLINDKHLKMIVSQDKALFEAIGFNCAALYPPPKNCQMAFAPYKDTWNGRTSYKLKIQGLKKCQ